MKFKSEHYIFYDKHGRLESIRENHIENVLNEIEGLIRGSYYFKVELFTSIPERKEDGKID